MTEKKDTIEKLKKLLAGALEEEYQAQNSREIEIKLTVGEYRHLLELLHAGDCVYGYMSDCLPEEYKKEYEDLEKSGKKIRRCGFDQGVGDLLEEFHGEVIPRDDLSEKWMEDLFEYDDIVFWDKLEDQLAKRDMREELNYEDKKKMKEDDHLWFEKIEEYKNRYRNEFEKHGTERLRVKK